VATYKLTLSELTPDQLQLLAGIMDLSKFKFPKIPVWQTKLDDFAIMGMSHVILAENGWFISLFLTDTVTSFDAATCFLSRKLDRDRGDKIMVAHYRETLDEIQKWAEDEFPNRRLILRKAFNAHRQRDYELSIPVMLAQADGIGEEIFGKDVSPSSQHSRKVNARKKFVEGIIDSATKKMFGDYYSLITSQLPINAGESQRTKFNSPLNRHLVLHGISTDYATEVNALKTISWLQYIISFKAEAKYKC